MKWQTYRSKLDSAVNYVAQTPTGTVETRFARKAGYDVVYVSSQTGCSQGCRFCHLTVAGRPATVPGKVSTDLLLEQVRHSTGSVSLQPRVHIDYMARGEPLLAPGAVNGAVMGRISDYLAQRGSEASHRISTIMPFGVGSANLSMRFAGARPIIYWSAYTGDDLARGRWMPRAVPADVAVRVLSDWSRSGGESRIHFAIVPGFNDSARAIDLLITALERGKWAPKVNLIEYNPAAGDTRSARITLGEVAAQFADAGIEVKRVPRLAPDVNVACGMFSTD